MTQYDLYRDLARAIYALALDAVRSRDITRVRAVQLIVGAAFEPLRDKLKGHTPAYDLLEYVDESFITTWSPDDGWDVALKNLEETRQTYPEVLG